MAAFKVILLLAFCNGVISEVQLLRPCESSDGECLASSTREFVASTYKGIPEYDMKPLDPLIIETMDYVVGDDLVIHFKHLNVTGMRNLVLSDCSMDLQKKSVDLSITVDLDVVGDATHEFKTLKKTLSGKYVNKINSKASAKYGYELRTDDKGVEHFYLDKETITCNILGNTDTGVDTDVRNAITKDPTTNEVLNSYNPQKEQLIAKFLCNIVEYAFSTLIHNVRACAKVFPKSAFFTDV